MTDGIIRCSRYAFGPNRLHYCGPDANRDVLAYINEGCRDPHLENLLKSFQTMFPYLKMIAQSNNIRDVFDDNVVSAYWLGNNLLAKSGHAQLYTHLQNNNAIKTRLPKKSFDYIINTIYDGAVPHHSFHVLNVWKRTGELNQDNNIKKLDSCKISWGKITKIDGPFVHVLSPMLLCINNKFTLSDNVNQKITRSFEADLTTEQLRIGDYVTFHWGQICEKISIDQARDLKKYTLLSMSLANKTL